VLVGGSDLLDVDELGVPRTAIAHPGGVGFGRFAPTEGAGAPPVTWNRYQFGKSKSLIPNEWWFHPQGFLATPQ